MVWNPQFGVQALGPYRQDVRTEHILRPGSEVFSELFYQAAVVAFGHRVRRCVLCCADNPFHELAAELNHSFGVLAGNFILASPRNCRGGLICFRQNLFFQQFGFMHRFVHPAPGFIMDGLQAGPVVVAHFFRFTKGALYLVVRIDNGLVTADKMDANHGPDEFPEYPEHQDESYATDEEPLDVGELRWVLQDEWEFEFHGLIRSP